MNILIVVGSLTGGGAERAAALWANGFSARGHKVAVAVCSNKVTNVRYDLSSDISLYSIKSYCGGFFSKYFHFENFRVPKVKKTIKLFKPDIIIGVMQPWAEVAYRAVKGQNIPIINSEQNSFERPDNAPMSRLTFKQKYEWNKQYTIVTLLTEADKLCVEGKLQNVKVLPNPLAFVPQLNCEKKEKIILAAGRINGWFYKGFDLLIKAWGDIFCQYPDWKLVIAGDGSMKNKEYLHSLIERWGIGKQVEFCGYVDILPLYQKASIFVLSSRYEAFGMVLIEAMSQGCACIACDYKGRQREIITSDKEGMICPVEDAKSISSAIKYLIENEDYRLLVQQNAIERSKYFSLDKIMDRWEDIFTLL